MAANFAEINWKKFEVAVPAFITIIMMPLSYSIATGIACGFIFYPITMLITKHKEVHPIMYFLMVLFILYFVFVHRLIRKGRCSIKRHRPYHLFE